MSFVLLSTVLLAVLANFGQAAPQPHGHDWNIRDESQGINSSTASLDVPTAFSSGFSSLTFPGTETTASPSDSLSSDTIPLTTFAPTVSAESSFTSSVATDVPSGISLNSSSTPETIGVSSEPLPSETTPIITSVPIPTTDSSFSVPPPVSSEIPSVTSSASDSSDTSSPSGSAGIEKRATSPSDVKAYLDAHNTFRAKHGAKPLTWSNDLASVAQNWANRCVFKHSGSKYGENLAAGTGSFSIPQAIKLWTDEASQYNPSNPQYSHFTQVVWKSTTQLGCAVATCNHLFSGWGPAKFYVCNYNPAGNVIGQFSQNVQP